MNKVEFSRTVKPAFAKRYGNFIGGRWVEPKSGRYFENTSPVNGQVLCEVARSDAADVEAALDAAHAAKDARARRARRNARSSSIALLTGLRKICLRSLPPKHGTTASQSAKPPLPIFLWPSTISAISPV